MLGMPRPGGGGVRPGARQARSGPAPRGERYAAERGKTFQAAPPIDFRELVQRADIQAVFVASPSTGTLARIAVLRAAGSVHREGADQDHRRGPALVQAQGSGASAVGTQQRSSQRFRLACELLVTATSVNCARSRLRSAGYAGPPVRAEPYRGLTTRLCWAGPGNLLPERLENLKGWMLTYDTPWVPIRWGSTTLTLPWAWHRPHRPIEWKAAHVPARGSTTRP